MWMIYFRWNFEVVESNLSQRAVECQKLDLDKDTVQYHVRSKVFSASAVYLQEVESK